MWRGASSTTRTFLYYTQHLIQDVRDYWRNQSYNAWQYGQEQSENAAQEFQRVPHEQVELAAALATNRAAAQVTSRFRDIEKTV